MDTPLNGITLDPTTTDRIIQMITVSKGALTYVPYDKVIWDLSVQINLIPLTD